MKRNLRSLPISLAGGLALLAGCGGSDDATLELMLMDAPPPGVTAVNIHVAAMQVHVVDKSKPGDADPGDTSIDDDSSWHSLTVDRSIDLVARQGEGAAEVLGQLPLPEGKITQIRLVIDTGKPNTATKNGVPCNLDVEKVARKGIKIEHPFKALSLLPGKSHQVWVDFQLDKSLKEKGSCFELEPKLKLTHAKRDGQDEVL